MSNTILDLKKELVYRDFDSLFIVYERQTNIIFSFRGWTISILTAYFGFLLIVGKAISPTLLYIIPLFIIICFLFLEVAERSVMLKLLKEVRYVESIFMEKKVKNLEKRILKYEFRDLRDQRETNKNKIKYFIRGFITPQVLFWYPFLIVATIVIIRLITSTIDASIIEITWISN